MEQLRVNPNFHSVTGKNLVNVILQLKEKNKFLKEVNKIKDGIIKAKILDVEKLKKEICVEGTFKAHLQLIAGQKGVIDDLKGQLEYQTKQLNKMKSRDAGNSAAMNSHQATIASLSNKLKEAEKYIDKQSYAIEKLQEKLKDTKVDTEGLKRALKERFVERLAKVKKEMEEKRETMKSKFYKVRDFYAAESDDLKKEINKLEDQLDLLRAADFNRLGHYVITAGRRKVISTATEAKAPSAAKRCRGRQPTASARKI